MQRLKPDPATQDTCRGFYSDILHFLRKRMDNASDAADMTQDVFAQWLGYRDRARVQQPRAFLFQVARNLLSDHWRRQKVRQATFSDDAAQAQQVEADNNPQDHAQREQRLEQLRQVLAELSPRRREALMLHRFEGLTQAQIAERMNISISMVEKHIAAALLQCKQRLDSETGREQPE
ncbi:MULTISPECIES: RNA polymerase sigma factor [unclassified Pseudomonas]|uniref:RNA polymerase sigma factor n=1 Tax=unclassified Pseudomonas TaxID=196821 RepID=UPI0035BEC40C